MPRVTAGALKDRKGRLIPTFVEKDPGSGFNTHHPVKEREAKHWGKGRHREGSLWYQFYTGRREGQVYRPNASMFAGGIGQHRAADRGGPRLFGSYSGKHRGTPVPEYEGRHHVAHEGQRRAVLADAT